jgi:hypothetical protein
MSAGGLDMKKALVISALVFMAIAGAIASSTDADAFVCARGYYRAGCVGTAGTAGFTAAAITAGAFTAASEAAGARGPRFSVPAFIT